MALGTALAIGATVGGSILGASATKKAANKAADTSLAVAKENNALAADIYGQNKSALSPFMERGNAAGDSINALLGIGGTNYTTPGTVDYAAYVNGNPDALENWNAIRGTTADTFGGDIGAFGQYHYGADGSRRDLSAYTRGGSQANADTTAAAQNAFSQYQDSTGYKFRMDQGMDALNTGFAGRGILNSGAARKSALEFGQNIGSAEFGNYLGYLGNQQGVGLSGASALAGVGQNYVNTVSANNNSAGSAVANAALAKGTANSNMWGGIASAAGNVFGSSFGGTGRNAFGISGGGIY